MKIFAVLLALLLLSSCAGSFEEARSSHAAAVSFRAAAVEDHCQSLDTAHRTWDAIAKTAGFLSGGSGLAEIPFGTDKDLRLGLAIGTVGMASVAVFAEVESQGFSSSWAKECSK